MPPRPFISKRMQLAVMLGAERDRVFVADFAPKRAGLCIFYMMRMGRQFSTDETWMTGDIGQVLAVSNKVTRPDLAHRRCRERAY